MHGRDRSTNPNVGAKSQFGVNLGHSPIDAIKES